MKEKSFKSKSDNCFLSPEHYVMMSDNDEVGEDLIIKSTSLSFL